MFSQRKIDIFSRKKLLININNIVSRNNLRDKSIRELVLNLLSDETSKAKLLIKKNFINGMSGKELVELNSFIVDQLIRTIHEITILYAYRATNPTESEKLSIVAVGGYGRSEMAPFSDIDLLFLHPYKLTVWAEQVIEHILYFLWDLGFNIGHAVRSIDECIRLSRSDISIATALLSGTSIKNIKKLWV